MHRRDDISEVMLCPCDFPADGQKHGGRFRHEHGHDHDHAHDHDGRPHVHNPDGTIRYLDEGELPSAPKRRRSSTKTEG